MRVLELAQTLGWDLASGDGARELTGGVYCCDLLSIVMGRAPANSLWVTVMGNVNAMAVASLADTACVVIVRVCRWMHRRSPVQRRELFRFCAPRSPYLKRRLPRRDFLI